MVFCYAVESVATLLKERFLLICTIAFSVLTKALKVVGKLEWQKNSCRRKCPKHVKCTAGVWNPLLHGRRVQGL